MALTVGLTVGLTRRALMHSGVVSAGACLGLGSFSVANAQITLAYDGPGVYLYPSWGEPRPYLVMPAPDGQSLEFSDPATRTVLWTQSSSLCRDFAGKLS